MRSHGCANFLIICAKCLLLNGKQEKKHFLMILAHFDKILQNTFFMAFLVHSSVQNCPFENLAAQKNSILEGLPTNSSFEVKSA